MAIDSALKRRSVSGIAFRKRGPGVTPDAAKPVAWRFNAGRMYSGIVSPTPGTGAGGPFLILARRRIRRS